MQRRSDVDDDDDDDDDEGEEEKAEQEKEHTKTLYVNLFVFAIKENIQALAFLFQTHTNTEHIECLSRKVFNLPIQCICVCMLIILLQWQQKVITSHINKYKSFQHVRDKTAR